jgi:hypothetical protein
LPPLQTTTYNGAFSGDDSGTFSVTISSTGTISGSGVSVLQGEFSVSGSATGNRLNFSAGRGGATTGASFSGTLDPDAGTVSGTWRNGEDHGTFSGKRI